MMKTPKRNQKEYVLTSHSLPFIGGIRLSALEISRDLKCNPITKHVIF